MESLPVDVLQSILCRVPLRDVFKLKAVSPEFNKLIELSVVKEVSELGRGVYWQNRSPAFGIMVGAEGNDDRANHFRISVVDTKGNIYDNMMPVVRGRIVVETTCKGLVLASITSFNELEIKCKGRKRLFVFNLSSGSSVEIPRPPRHCDLDGDDDYLELCFNWYSMGFDVETSVCTVIRITPHHSRRMALIDIYSSETLQWKTLDFPPIFLTVPPLYSKGSFFFLYARCYEECTRIGVFSAKDCTFNSVALPLGGRDHYDQVNWTFHGREDHLTLVFHNKFINRSDSKRDCWNFKEEVLFRGTKENKLTTPPDEKGIVHCDVNCWENCNPRTTQLVELGNAIHSEEDVFSEWEADYTLDYDTHHLGVSWSWKDGPDDKFRVYNVKGEVVNTFTLSHLHSALSLPPIVDEDQVPEQAMLLVYIRPLEINNIAWPWPQHDYESFTKLEWMDDAGMPDSHP